MSDHVNSLRPGARNLLDADKHARLDYVMQDRLIGYPAAQAVENALRDLMRFDACGMLPNILLSGPSRNGKTSVMKRILKEHSKTVEGGQTPRMPILIINMPSPPKEKELWATVIRVMLGRVPPRAQTYALKAQALDLMGYADVRALVIDEFQHVLKGSSREREQMLGLIKNLSNELQIPLICAGLPEVRQVLLEDMQYAGRFASFELPPWRLNGEFRRLLGNFERTLPFVRPSRLDSDENAPIIYSGSDNGLLGWIWLRVREAARLAIEQGMPCIETEHLRKVSLPTFRQAYGAASGAVVE